MIPFATASFAPFAGFFGSKARALQPWRLLLVVLLPALRVVTCLGVSLLLRPSLSCQAKSPLVMLGDRLRSRHCQLPGKAISAPNPKRDLVQCGVRQTLDILFNV